MRFIKLLMSVVKKIIKIFLALFIIVFVPTAFALGWIMVGHTEWQSLLKISEKQLQRFLPDYEIKADSITTEGYGIDSFGTIFFRINNFLLDDVKNHTIKINIQDAYFSLSIKEFLFGRFIPIIYTANNLDIQLNLDKIAIASGEFNTQALVSYCANYLSRIVDYSLDSNDNRIIDIKNINFKFTKDNKQFANLLIDSNKTSISYKKIGFFTNENYVTYDFKFFINKIPSQLKLICGKDDEADIFCKVKAKDVSIDALFNEANKKDNLALSQGSLINIDGVGYIKNGNVKIAKGKIYLNKHFTLFNPINKNKIGIDDFTAEFIVTDNLQKIELRELVVNLEKKETLYIDEIKADFLHKTKLSIFDYGSLKFRTNKFPINDLYYHAKIILADKTEQSLRGLLNDIFIAPNAVLEASGGFSWESIKNNPGSKKKFTLHLTDYNIDIGGASDKAIIPSLDKLELLDVKVDINLKPEEIKVKFNNAKIFGSNINNISFFYKNDFFEVTIDEKNKKIDFILHFIDHVLHLDIAKKINFLDVDRSSSVHIAGKIKMPITNNIKKAYFKTDIDLLIKTNNFKSFYIDGGQDLVSFDIQKRANTSIVELKGKINNLTFLDNGRPTESHKDCNILLPMLISFNNTKMNLLNANDVTLVCGSKKLLQFDLSYNEKNQYYIDAKIVKFWNNDIGFIVFNNESGYHATIKGKNINLIPILTLLDKMYSSESHTEQHSVTSNTINLKIKTDRMQKIRYIFDMLLQKTDNINKLIPIKVHNIDINLDIKNIFMLNDYSIKDLNGSISVTKTHGLLANIIGSIKRPANAAIEYIIFTISKNKTDSKDVYFRCSGVNRFIKSLLVNPNRSIKHGDLTVKGVLDKNGNIEGTISIGEILYSRKDARIFKDIRLDKISAKASYDYIKNILVLKNGEISGTGIVGDFDSILDLNNEYFDFLIRVAIGGTAYGIADIPIIGNILTLSLGDHRYLSGFKYHLNGYLNKELNGSLKTLRGTSWLTGYIAMMILALQ